MSSKKLGVMVGWASEAGRSERKRQRIATEAQRHRGREARRQGGNQLGREESTQCANREIGVPRRCAKCASF